MSKKFKILIGTYPFGNTGRKPVELLEETGWEIVFNPYNRRLKPGDLDSIIHEFDAVIAGTEPYNADTLKNAKRLKVISRVGIGLDSVDLSYCKQHNIKVAYTPEAPSDSVAELTVANILNLLRHIYQSDRSVREGAWNRLMGFLVREVKIGVIGVGRIGGRVIKLLQTFQPSILAYDINPDVRKINFPNTTWVDLDDLLKQSDIISIHIPLNDENRCFINRQNICKMKTGAALINTARGAIIDEEALFDALIQKHLSGAALDVYSKEPYQGPLSQLDNVVLTAHIAASANESRFKMELGATEGCINALNGTPLTHDAIADNYGYLK